MLIALDNTNESPFLPKYHIRFHIAHCYDASGDFRRGSEEYRKLLSDHERGQIQLPLPLLSAVFRQLGEFKIFFYYTKNIKYFKIFLSFLKKIL